MVKKLQNSREGNIVLLFALLLVPLLLAAGMGVDYSRAMVARSDVQEALDAAVIAGLKSAPQDRRKNANAMFELSLAQSHVLNGVSIKPVLNPKVMTH